MTDSQLEALAEQGEPHGIDMAALTDAELERIVNDGVL